MKVRVKEIGDVSVLEFSGRITIGEGDVLLREHVGELLGQDRKRILLNLEQISYMDSAGIGELVSCYNRVKEADGTLKLLPSDKVRDLLEITRFGTIFDTFDDEKEALVSF